MGVLLTPQFQKRNGQPAFVYLQLVDDGMTGGTKSDQPPFLMNARPPVMDGRLVPCPAACLAGLTPIPVTQKNLVADAGKVVGGMPAPGVAGGAKSGDRGQAAAVGAEERFLAGMLFL